MNDESGEIEVEVYLSKAGGKPAAAFVTLGDQTVWVKSHADGTFMYVHGTFYEVPLERTHIADLSRFFADASVSLPAERFVRWLTVSSQGEDWFFTVWRSSLHVCALFNNFTAGCWSLTLPLALATKLSETIEKVLALAPNTDNGT